MAFSLLSKKFNFSQLLQGSGSLGRIKWKKKKKYKFILLAVIHMCILSSFLIPPYQTGLHELLILKKLWFLGLVDWGTTTLFKPLYVSNNTQNTRIWRRLGCVLFLWFPGLSPFYNSMKSSWLTLVALVITSSVMLSNKIKKNKRWKKSQG